MAITVKTWVYRNSIHLQATSQLRGWHYNVSLTRDEDPMKHGTIRYINAGCRRWSNFEQAETHYRSGSWSDDMLTSKWKHSEDMQNWTAYRVEARCILKALKDRHAEVIKTKFGQDKTYPGTHEVIDLERDAPERPMDNVSRSMNMDFSRIEERALSYYISSGGQRMPDSYGNSFDIEPYNPYRRRTPWGRHDASPTGRAPVDVDRNMRQLVEEMMQAQIIQPPRQTITLQGLELEFEFPCVIEFDGTKVKIRRASS